MLLQPGARLMYAYKHVGSLEDAFRTQMACVWDVVNSRILLSMDDIDDVISRELPGTNIVATSSLNYVSSDQVIESVCDFVDDNGSTSATSTTNVVSDDITPPSTTGVTADTHVDDTADTSTTTSTIPQLSPEALAVVFFYVLLDVFTGKPLFSTFRCQ